MFAKSKRFQDVQKDSLPGPGDYNVTIDEFGKHKRFGFLNQSLRFTENSVEFPPQIFTSGDSYSASLSSDSYVSTGSKDDMRARHQITEMAAQFDKYRLSMQKEFESLHAKNRKMETSLQTVMTEKEQAAAAILNKDQELADIRLKNTALQKTITRLEKNIDKSPKVIQLQKRISLLENELNAAQSEADAARAKAQQEQALLQSDVAARDEIIAALQEKIQRHADVVERMDEQLKEQQMSAKRMEEDHLATLELMSTKLQTTTEKLAESEHLMYEKSCQLEDLNRQLSALKSELDTMSSQKARLEHEKEQMTLQHQSELDACHHEHTTLQHTIEQLQASVQSSQEAFASLEARWHSRQLEVDALQNQIKQTQAQYKHQQDVSRKLQKKFQLYRAQATNIMLQLQNQLKPDDNAFDSEAERLAAELLEAKKFINRQGLELEGIKSELHWLSKWNTYLQDILKALHRDSGALRDILSLCHPSHYTHVTHAASQVKASKRAQRSSVDSGFESRLSLYSDA